MKEFINKDFRKTHFETQRKYDWGFTSQNHDLIIRDAVVEGSGNFDHLDFFNVH